MLRDGGGNRGGRWTPQYICTKDKHVRKRIHALTPATITSMGVQEESAGSHSHNIIGTSFKNCWTSEWMPLEKNTGRLFKRALTNTTRLSGNDNKLRTFGHFHQSGWHVTFHQVLFFWDSLLKLLGLPRRFLTRSIFGFREAHTFTKLSRAVPAWTTSTLMKVCFFFLGGWVSRGEVC